MERGTFTEQEVQQEVGVNSARELGIIAHALLQAFKHDRFIYGYSGLFEDDLTTRLLDLSDGISDAMSSRPGVRKRLGFLLVETYQNIIRHRAGLPHYIDRGEGRSFFFCRANPAAHDLVAINGVHKQQVDHITAQLDAVRGLDHAELKEVSMNMLQRASSGRGAGVGFIEMTRRSGNDLGHMLRGMGPDYSLLALAVRSGEGYTYEKIIRDAAILHGTVVMNDLLLFHAGHMPGAVSAVIAAMLRHDVEPFVDADVALRRATQYEAWADALRNLDHEARCVCVLARTHDGLMLVQGAQVDPANVPQQVSALMERGRQHASGSLHLADPQVWRGGTEKDPVVFVALRL